MIANVAFFLILTKMTTSIPEYIDCIMVMVAEIAFLLHYENSRNEKMHSMDNPFNLWQDRTNHRADLV